MQPDLFASSTARFSPCRRYRYELWRRWDVPTAPFAMFIGLNPSTADETADDPTIRRCIRFARDWGFGGLLMTNLFAFRATDPAVMKAEAEPVGPENSAIIQSNACNAGIIIAAWGVHGVHMGRDRKKCWHRCRERHPDQPQTSVTTMEDDHEAGSGCPSHDLFSVAGDTPETDQLIECDQYKIDEDAVEYSAYRRMVEHAQALERRLIVAPSEKEGCARLIEEAEYEIFDVVDDGQPVVIELHPGRNGRSSYLFWRPLKDADEAQLWEFVHDSLGPEIRNVSFLGEPARALRKFITENA